MNAAPTMPALANDAQRGSHCVQRLVGRHSTATLYKGDCSPFWETYRKVANNYYFNTNHELRVKPEPKLRPWTSNEVPVGAVVRYKGNKDSIRMLIVSSQEPNLLGFHGSRWRCCDLCDSMEHSTDGGKTWLPCGVEEIVT